MNVGNVQVPNLDKILRDNDESDFMPAAGYVYFLHKLLIVLIYNIKKM